MGSHASLKSGWLFSQVLLAGNDQGIEEMTYNVEVDVSYDYLRMNFGETIP